MSFEPPFREGDIVCGRFRIASILTPPGTTAYAARACDEILNEEVVCKIGLWPGEDARETMKRQYRALRDTHCRSLVQAMGYFEHDDYPVLVLEAVDGTTLDAWAKGRSRRQLLGAYVHTVRAVAALHAVGTTHGDVHARNVIVSAEGRAVLIDPEPASFGSMSGRPVEGTPTRAGDLVGLADVAQRIGLADDLRLARIVHELACALETMPDIAGIVTNLDAILDDHALPFDAEVWVEQAERHGEDRTNRHALYRRIVEVRHRSFADLIAAARALGAPFGVRLAHGDEIEDLPNLERTALEAGRGVLCNRHVIFESPDDDRWRLTLKAHDGFRKPWPDNQHVGLIGSGDASIGFGNETVCVENIEIWFDGERVSVVVVNGDRRVRADDQWIQRCIRILTAATIPGLREPIEIAGEKRSVEQMSDIDISRVENGDYGRLHGAAVLERLVHRFLQTRKGGFVHLPNFGSTIGTAFDEPEHRLRALVEKAAQEDFKAQFWAEVDVLYRFDLVHIDRIARRLRVEVELRPHGLELVEWSFDCDYSAHVSVQSARS